MITLHHKTQHANLLKAKSVWILGIISSFLNIFSLYNETLLLNNLYSTFIFFLLVVSNFRYDNHVPQIIGGIQGLFLNTASACFQWRIKLQQLPCSPCFIRFRVVFVNGLCKINHTLQTAWGELFMAMQHNPVDEALVCKANQEDWCKMLLAIPLLHAIT